MALPIRRGGRFPASLFEPTALWDPVSEFDYMRDRMGRLYEQLTQQGHDQSPWQPDIEVDETEEYYTVKAELPGITRENVELQVDEHSLSIAGSVREEQSEQTMHRRAGRFFYRTVLPRDIDTEKVQATMREGILTIRLPKTKQATRRVQIRA
ncbi:MAG TPA: Hsp20/alpha crystallin family protein [Streptosporangiaceae bacterium]|nr:Hsp20/alpha crystallin family protein [Streptosporangiaceae bacterium]